MTQLNEWILAPGNLGLALAAFALLPAICEELAFRGFILNGLQRGGNRWTAILVSSFCFAATHTILQQSIVAACVGLLLGLLAVRSNSLWPGLAFHATHNSMALLTARWAHSWPDFQTWTITQDGNYYYHPLLTVLSVLASGGLFAFFWKYGNATPVHISSERSGTSAPNAGENLAKSELDDIENNSTLIAQS